MTKVELDELLARADFITLHVPMTDKTRGILNAEAHRQVPSPASASSIAPAAAWSTRRLSRPPSKAVMSRARRSTCSRKNLPRKTRSSAWSRSSARRISVLPHRKRRRTSRCRSPSRWPIIFSPARSPIRSTCLPSRRKKRRSLPPFLTLARQLGSFAGQLTESGISEVTVEYAGDVAEMNTRVLTNAALTGLLKPQLEDVNMVSAPVIARERDIKVSEVKREQQGAYETYIRIVVKTERQERSVAGTVFSGGLPRIIQIKGVNMEAALGPHMLYVTNQDKPGFIGALGSTLGKVRHQHRELQSRPRSGRAAMRSASSKSMPTFPPTRLPRSRLCRMSCR